jgi:cytochrome c-type biogenesis protein CcmH
MLAQGATRQEVLDFFVERYGAGVLAAPPKSGFNLLAWIFPMVAVPAALIGGLLALKAMRRRPGASGATAEAPGLAPDAALAPYLDQVERDLAGGAPLPPRGGAATDG